MPNLKFTLEVKAEVQRRKTMWPNQSGASDCLFQPSAFTRGHFHAQLTQRSSFFFSPSKKPFRRTYGPTPRPQQVNHVTPLIATTDLKAATGTGLGVDRPKIVPRVPERARVPLVAMVYVRDREHPPRRTLCFSQRRHAAGSYSLLFKGRFAGKFYHLSRTALFQRRWRLSSNPFGSRKYGGCSR